MRLFIILAISLLSAPVFGQFKINFSTTTPLCGQPECEDEAKLQDSLNLVSEITQKSSNVVESDKSLRFEDYIDDTDIIAYATQEESKPNFQLVKSKAYFLESLNIVFFIPKSYTSTIESIRTPYARTEKSTFSISGEIWRMKNYTANAYFYNLALPFRTHVTEMIHLPIQDDFFSIGH